MKPSLESLEDRCVPAVLTDAHLDVLFIGPNSEQAHIQALVADAAQQLPGILQVYGIGSLNVGAIDYTGWDQATLDDTGNSGYPTQLQSVLLGEINAGRLPANDGHQLYLVFTGWNTAANQPIHVEANLGPFVGYHGVAGGGLPYAVIPFPGPPNYQDGSEHPLVWTIDRATTHEIGEALMNFTAVTPDEGGEIGDKYNGQTDTIDGFFYQVFEGPDGGVINPGNPPQFQPPPGQNPPPIFTPTPNPFMNLQNLWGFYGNLYSVWEQELTALWSAWEAMEANLFSLEVQLWSEYGGFHLVSQSNK